LLVKRSDINQVFPAIMDVETIKESSEMDYEEIKKYMGRQGYDLKTTEKKLIDQEVAALQNLEKELTDYIIREKLRQEFEKAGVDWEEGLVGIQAEIRNEFRVKEEKATADFIERKNEIYRKGYGDQEKLIEEAEREMRRIVLEARIKMYDDLIGWTDPGVIVDFYKEAIRRLKAEMEGLEFEDMEIIKMADPQKVKSKIKEVANYWYKIEKERILAAYLFQKREILISEKTTEEKKKLLEDLDDWRDATEKLAEKRMIEAMYDSFPELRAYYDERLKTIDIFLESVGLKLEEQTDPEKGLWATWGNEVERATNFVIDQLQKVNDFEIQNLSEKISRYDTEIAELQRNLDQQYQLQREGKNITEAKTGDKVAVSMEEPTIGRQINEGDVLVSVITRGNIQGLKQVWDKLQDDEKLLLKKWGLI